MGGRIPTFEETRSIYAYAEALKKKKEAERQLGRTVPAVNAYVLSCPILLSLLSLTHFSH